MSLLDILFPKACIYCKKFGSYLCPNCFARLSFDTQHICLICGKHAFDGLTHPLCKSMYNIDGAFCGVVYGKVMQKLMYVFKYQPYLVTIQHILIDLLFESLVQKEACMGVLSQKAFLVPIPLSAKKYRQRGYNQSLLLAKGMKKKFGLEIFDCLQRIKETKPQYGLKKEERKENMKNAFKIKPYVQAGIYKDRFRINPGMTAVLVDDILTTGATLLEAAKVLKHYGFKKVYAITLARDQ